MRTTNLVGRRTEIDRAEQTLASVTAATGHALLISGEAGIGKSTLLEALLKAAGDRFRIAAEGASQLETDLPFAPLVRALALRRSSPDPDAAALGTLMAEHDGSDPELLRLRVIEGIADLVERWALERPVLLAVEDLHWADDATIQTLDRLARRLQHVGVLVAGTTRPHPRSATLRAFERTLADIDATVIELEPLSGERVVELASNVLGGEPGPALTEALIKAGGNPLYVTELLAAAQAENGAADGTVELPAPGVPNSVRLTILRNVSFLPSSTLEVLRTAAVLGTRFDLRQLALALDRPEDQVVGDLLPAFVSRVVSDAGDRIAFRHDLVREAISEDQPRAVRAATHRRIVERLRAAGLADEELVPHLLRGEWQSVPEATGWLTEAGQAMRGRSLAVATELFERAVGIAGEEADPDLRLDLAEVLAAADRPEDAVATLMPVLATPLASLDEAVRDRLVEFAGPLAEQTRAADERTAWLDELEAAGLSARGEGRAAATRAWMHWAAGQRDEAAALATRALTISVEVGDHPGACALELLLARIAEGSGWDERPVAHAREALRHAQLAASRPELVLAASVTLAIILGNDSSLRAEAERVISEGLVLADRIGLAIHQAALEAVAAMNAQRAGDWNEAAVRYEAALETLPNADEVTIAAAGSALFHTRAATLLVHRDDLDRAAELVEVARQLWSKARATGHEPDELVSMHLAEAELRLAFSDPDAAVAALQEMAAFIDGRDIPVYHAGTLPVVTAIAWQADHPDEARAAVERAERFLRNRDVGDPTLASLVRWCRARLNRDATALEELVDWADGPRPLWEWRPRIREDAAAVLAEGGRTERAVQRLEEAFALWDDVGAARDVARVRKSLRDLGVHRGRGLAAGRPDTGWASLTDAEWRVVELVEEGLIYREIGERLFISRRTVETHIQHVFRKLGISSRRELTVLLQTDEGRSHLMR